MRIRRSHAVATIVAGACALLLPRAQHWHVPPQWNPSAPLDIDAPVNWLTRFKLDRLADDRAACTAALAQTLFRVKPLADRDTGDGCGFRDAVMIGATDFSVAEPFALTCPAAVALALWERHDVQPAAQAVFGTDIVSMQHFGSYACRNLYGRTEGPRSQHATAEALDVAGFTLADGRRITVAADWSGNDGDAARFLRRIHDGACRTFDAVLGPDYNAAHRDHLHLDVGSYRACR